MLMLPHCRKCGPIGVSMSLKESDFSSGSESGSSSRPPVVG